MDCWQAALEGEMARAGQGLLAEMNGIGRLEACPTESRAEAELAPMNGIGRLEACPTESRAEAELALGNGKRLYANGK